MAQKLPDLEHKGDVPVYGPKKPDLDGWLIGGVLLLLLLLSQCS